MAYIIGTSDTTGYTGTMNINSGASLNTKKWSATGTGGPDGKTATASANAATLNLLINNWNTVANVKACLYDEGSLAEVVIINNSVGTGLVSVSMAGTTAITSGNNYVLAFYTDTNDSIVFDSKTGGQFRFRENASGGTYSSPSATLGTGTFEAVDQEMYWSVEDAAAPGRSITNIDGDNSVQAGQTNVDIATVGLDASPSTQTANLVLGTTGSAALTVNTWAATNVNVDIPLHIDLKWGVSTYAVELTDDTGTVTGSANVTLATAAGWQTITFNGTIPTASTTESFYEAAITDADLGGGGYTMSTTGNDILLLGTTDSTLTVNADTTFSVSPAKAISADYKIWSESNQSFTDVSDFAITISGSISTGDESPISTNAINTAFAIRDAITTNAITKSEG